MKLITLVENLVYQPQLISEHGLSFYLDTGSSRILFDTGQSDVLVRNAKVLGIDLSKVDALIISHGHNDHTGGLNAFLRENDKAPVYLKKEALYEKYNRSMNYIGAPPVNDEFRNRLVFVEELTVVDEGVFIVPQIPVRNNTDTSFENFYVNKGNGMEKDLFDDELFLAIVHDNKLSVLSSCSHRGISNIMIEARRLFNLPVNLITGGFHLKNAQQEQLSSVIDYLRILQPENIGICHCTGVEKYTLIKMETEGNIFYNYTGNVVKI